MSRIDEMQTEIQWKDTSTREHPDYKRNLQTAKNFIEKTKKSIINGMDVKISNGNRIESAILMISWTPPRESKLGNYATPISLHQGSKEMSKQLESVFSCYFRAAQDHQKSNASQRDFIKNNFNT